MSGLRSELPNSNSTSRHYLRWLVFGFSTYYLYAFVASIRAALISLLICNWKRRSSWCSGGTVLPLQQRGGIIYPKGSTV
jgi:hypothetical protein